MRILLALAPALLLAAGSPEPPEQYRAFWVDAYHAGYKNAAEADKLIEDVAASHCNAIFLQVRRRADSYYLKTPEVPAQDPTYSQDFDALAYIVDRAHARGIEVHAWFVVYPLWQPNIPPPVNPAHLYYKHGPGQFGRDLWLTFSSTGRTGNSLDPGHPAVQRYLASVITGPLRDYDIDGIHLDYIRYEESADSGYNFAALERFRRLANASPTGPPRNDPEWNGFRRGQVTSLVRQIYLRAHELKPAVKISAALISWGDAPAGAEAFQRSASYAKVFQDWLGWMREGILDLGVPMHYFREPGAASRLERWYDFTRAHQYGRRYVPGIGLYLNAVSASQRQMKRLLKVNSGGSPPAGIGLYSYASTSRLNAAGGPTQPHRSFLDTAASFFRQPAAVPRLPWLESPVTGHLAGVLVAPDGPEWWVDGVRVLLHTETGAEPVRETTTDATGFYGFVDLDPGRYRITMLRGASILHGIASAAVVPGRVARYDVALSRAGVEAALPHVTGARHSANVPGGVLSLLGVNLAPAEVTAPDGAAMPLLGGVRVFRKDGASLPLLYVSPTRIDVLLTGPSHAPEVLTVRHSGMDAAGFAYSASPAPPVIEEVKPLGQGAFSLYASGLGAEPGRVRVLYSGGVADILETALVEGRPGLRQINVMIEPAAHGAFRLEASGAVSPPFPF